MADYSWLELFYSVVALILLAFAFSFFLGDFSIISPFIQLFSFGVSALILALLGIIALFITILSINAFLAIFFILCLYYFREWLLYFVAIFVVLVIFF